MFLAKKNANRFYYIMKIFGKNMNGSVSKINKIQTIIIILFTVLNEFHFSDHVHVMPLCSVPQHI